MQARAPSYLFKRKQITETKFYDESRSDRKNMYNMYVCVVQTFYGIDNYL